jgi:nucleoside-diphosphate-sugar epimerase
MSSPSPALRRGARLFLTGGTGFVGRSLLRFLNESANGFENIRITVLTRDPERFAARHPALARGVEMLRGDVRDFVWPKTEFSHVIHAATDTSVDTAGRPRELIETIVEGAARVLAFAAACGAEKMLFLSSGAVYGRQPDALERIPEDYAGAPDPADPASAYGNAKRVAEQLCASAASGRLAVKVARPFAFVGEDLPLDAHFAIGNFIRDALAGGPIRVQGDGSPVRSYLYQSDLAQWLLEILERGQPGRAYNVGSDQPISIAELARLVADVISPTAAVHISGQRADYRGRLRYVPSIERARSELGLVPHTPLAEAIRRTAARRPG